MARRSWLAMIPHHLRRGQPGPQLLDLPLQDIEAPFLRPPRRTRPRRTRRGPVARLVLGLQLGGALLATLAALWTGYSSVMASERLRVRKVEVRGSRFLSEGEVRELLGPAVGENILGLDIDELKARLRASPWVADASVGRTLPDTLTVEFRERVPLALAELDRLYLMDGDGVLIDVYGPRTAAFDLPIVRGLAGVAPEARRDRAQRAGALLRELAELAAEISEVRVEDGGDLRVVLRGASEVLRMAPPFRKPFLSFLGLRKELAERCPGAEYFDLRFRDRIYTRPLPAAPHGGTAVPLIPASPAPAPSADRPGVVSAPERGMEPTAPAAVGAGAEQGAATQSGAQAAPAAGTPEQRDVALELDAASRRGRTNQLGR